jgi:hypothetical protein
VHTRAHRPKEGEGRALMNYIEEIFSVRDRNTGEETSLEYRATESHLLAAFSSLYPGSFSCSALLLAVVREARSTC